MKNFLKKFAVVFVLCTLVSSSICIGASENAVPLYDKYGYDDNFVYEDEYIAHALKSSVVLVTLNYETTVEYQPVTFNIDSIVAYIESQYEEYNGLYSKAEISRFVVEDMHENLAAYLTWGDVKTVPVETSWQGSGVVIDEFGYIATNSHVVSLSNESKLEACMENLQSGVIEDLKKVIEDIAEIDITLSDEQIDELYDIVISETSERARIDDEESSLYVCFPSASGETDIDKDRAYKAKVVAEGIPVNAGDDGTTQDAAILEIQNEGLVALRLSETYPEVNSKIVSAGFPVAADWAFQSAGSSKSVLSVTIGTGNISRHVPIEGSDYKAMEISTTISGGNSGGPSVDEKLFIEGLNTYSSVADNRYSYMIPAEYVAELAKDFEVGQGEVSLTFLTGLQMLQQGYGAAALECFEEVKNQKEDTPYIENLIELAQNEPQNYPAGTQNSDSSRAVDLKLIAIAGAALTVVIVVIIVLVLKAKKKKSKKTSDRYNAFNTMDIPYQNTQNNYQHTGNANTNNGNANYTVNNLSDSGNNAPNNYNNNQNSNYLDDNLNNNNQ